MEEARIVRSGGKITVKGDWKEIIFHNEHIIVREIISNYGAYYETWTGKQHYTTETMTLE